MFLPYLSSKILEQHGPSVTDVKGWPVIGQFSSIGSLGNDKTSWLCGEWYTSLGTTKGPGASGLPSVPLLVGCYYNYYC